MDTGNIVLSLRIGDLPIKKLDKIFFEKYGVVYLGEFFAFFRAYQRSISKFHHAKAVLRIIEILDEFGYSPTADPMWTPPTTTTSRSYSPHEGKNQRNLPQKEFSEFVAQPLRKHGDSRVDDDSFPVGGAKTRTRVLERIPSFDERRR